jgi:DNA-binding XRE family transcriptional regulator
MEVNEKHLEILAKNLKHLRQIANLKQEELANRVGVTRQVIVAIETGKKLPSKSLFFAIVSMFLFIASTTPLLKIILDSTRLSNIIKNIWGGNKGNKEDRSS